MSETPELCECGHNKLAHCPFLPYFCEVEDCECLHFAAAPPSPVGTSAPEPQQYGWLPEDCAACGCAHMAGADGEDIGSFTGRCMKFVPPSAPTSETADRLLLRARGNVRLLLDLLRTRTDAQAFDDRLGTLLPAIGADIDGARAESPASPSQPSEPPAEMAMAMDAIAEEHSQLVAMTAERDALREAATAFLAMYVAMVESGDCGNWNPEDEPEVQALRAALAASRPTTEPTNG